jgi:pimeloyl-ACP methyl ester carboxylesterase
MGDDQAAASKKITSRAEYRNSAHGGSMSVASIAAEIRDGRDPPVVMVSPLGEPATNWQPVIKQLRTGPQVITYDRPGIGASPPRTPPNPPLTYSAFASELAALLDHLGIGSPVVLVGHSVGSLIIRMFAAAHPEQVAGMVHVDGSLPRLILWPGGGSSIDGDGPDATEIDLASGETEVMHAELPLVPSIVLARTPGRWATPPPDPAIDGLWQRAQVDLARRSGAALIIAKDSGHRIPADAPGLVAFAVDQVVIPAREGNATAAPTQGGAERAGGNLVE